LVVGDQSVTAPLVEFPAKRQQSEKSVGTTWRYGSARDEYKGYVFGGVDSGVTAAGLARDAKKAGCDMRRRCGY